MLVRCLRPKQWSGEGWLWPRGEVDDGEDESELEVVRKMSSMMGKPLVKLLVMAIADGEVRLVRCCVLCRRWLSGDGDLLKE